MKVAPLIKALEARTLDGKETGIAWRLVHTGQHYDAQMSDIFFGELGISPRVMIDALIANLERARASRILNTGNLKKKGFVYVTLHRPSNVDKQASLTKIMRELKRLAGALPVVFPMHPRTRKMCGEFDIPLDSADGLRIVEPIGYHDSLCLIESAR